MTLYWRSVTWPNAMCARFVNLRNVPPRRAKIQGEIDSKIDFEWSGVFEKHVTFLKNGEKKVKHETNKKKQSVETKIKPT